MEREQLDRGPWIQKRYAGKYYPLDPRPEEIQMDDIAHCLANLCRFTGDTREFYSVAQHCWLMSFAVPAQFALLALMHDSAEAYIGDISRPLKRTMRIQYPDGELVTFKELERRTLQVIGVAIEMPDLFQFASDNTYGAMLRKVIDDADMLMLATEARDVLACIHDDWRVKESNGFRVLDFPIKPVPPHIAEDLFKSRYMQLRPEFVVEPAQHAILKGSVSRGDQSFPVE